MWKHWKVKSRPVLEPSAFGVAFQFSNHLIAICRLLILICRLTRRSGYLVTYRVLWQGRSQGGVPRVHVHPHFQKQKTKNYFLCRIIRFYTNNPKCQNVYLSFYLNDNQIIEEWNWKISYFQQEVTFNLEKESTFSKKKIQHE